MADEHEQLSALTDRLPDHFTTLESLYSLYTEHLRPLPLATFAAFLSPSTLPHMVLSARTSLTQLLLRSLISSSAPAPPPGMRDEDGKADDITLDLLETCYLPYTANTVSAADNAKVSLLVEALLRLLAQHVGLVTTPTLKTAVEDGIAARENKAAAKAGVRRSDCVRRGEDLDWLYLRASAMRLRGLVEVMGGC